MRFAYRSDVDCEGFVCKPNGLTPAPCVIVAPSWAGEGADERRKAEQFCDLGYVGFAMDIYGRDVRGSHDQDNFDLMNPLLERREIIQRRMLDTVAAAAAMPGVDPTQIFVVGYCFGGLCALDLARTGTDVVRGVISVHGILAPIAAAVAVPIKTSVLVLHGWDDPMARPSAVSQLATEMTTAGADWELDAYGKTMHAFTDPDANAPDRGVRYDARAAARSWSRILRFLEDGLTR